MTGGRRDESGATLVELSVALGLLGILLVAALGSFGTGWRRSADLDRETVRQAEAREALDVLVADLRQAFTGDPALSPVTAIGASTITFHSPDRATPYRLRRITYRRTGSVLERSVTTSTNAGGAPWTFGTTAPFVPLVSGLQAGTMFTALDAAGAVTTTPAAVRQVDVRFAVDVARSGSSPVRVWVTSVHLRSAS